MIYTRLLSPFIITPFIIALSPAFAGIIAFADGFAQTPNDAPDAVLRMELFSIPDARDNPLEITVLSRTEKEDVVLEEIMFNGASFNGMPTRIYAWLSHPKREGKHPGVVRLHGAGLRQALASESAVDYARAGYVCLCIDWAGREEHGVKRPSPRSDFNAFARISRPRLDKDGNPVAGRVDLSDPAADTITNGVRFVRRALQFLRARPDVDPSKLCLSAMSAGAHLSLLALAVEPGVKAAALKYGSGFVRELNWGGYFGRLKNGGPDAASRWLSVLDPKHGLADIRTPTLLLSGTDDIFFFMPAVLATWRALPAPKALLMLPNDNHTKVRDETIPLQWFESVMHGVPAWPRARGMTAKNTDENLVLSAQCEGKVTQAFFWYKRMPRATFKYGAARKPGDTVPWQSVAARQGRDGAWTVSIATPTPNEQVVAYCMFETADGVRESSDTVEIPAMEKWGRDLQPVQHATDNTHYQLSNR
jgi:cephalosporin-C deacetylase-like acetyl esterase